MAFLSGLKKLGSAFMPPPTNPYSVATPPFLPQSDSAPDETGDYTQPMPPPVPPSGAAPRPMPPRLDGGSSADPTQQGPPPLPRMDAKGGNLSFSPPQGDQLAAPPPKPKTAMEQYAEMQAPPVRQRSSVGRQLAAGLLRLAPGVNMTDIPDEIAAPGYRQQVAQWQAQKERLGRAADVEKEMRERQVADRGRDIQEKQWERMESRDAEEAKRKQMELQADIDKQYQARGGVKVPDSFNLDPSEAEDYTVEQDALGGFRKVPTAAKQARDITEQKKLAEQVNWLPVPKKYQAEFGLPDRVPPQTLQMVISDLDRRQQRQEANELRKYIADQSNATRRDLAAIAQGNKTVSADDPRIGVYRDLLSQGKIKPADIPDKNLRDAVMVSGGGDAVPSAISPKAAEMISTAEGVLDQVKRLKEQIQAKGLAGDNTPGKLFFDRAKYALGMSSDDDTAGMLADLNLASVIGAARVLKGSSRAYQIFNKAMEHTPNTWKDSPKLIYDKLDRIQANLEEGINEAKKYGNKQGVVQQPSTAAPGKVPSVGGTFNGERVLKVTRIN